jgi:hypothetical protein
VGDTIQAMTGRSAEDIHGELVAQQAELRAAGLSLTDATGAPIETQLLWVMDFVPADTSRDLLLFAPLIYVAATFSSPSPNALA